MEHFRLVSRIIRVLPESIFAEADFNKSPLYTGLEAMAQLSAMHVRQALEFERHAFLLKVNQWVMPVMHVLDGCYSIQADLRSQSSNAFAYEVETYGPNDIQLRCELLIGTKDYDNHFRKDVLKVHYQKVFKDLIG